MMTHKRKLRHMHPEIVKYFSHFYSFCDGEGYCNCFFYARTGIDLNFLFLIANLKSTKISFIEHSEDYLKFDVTIYELYYLVDCFYSLRSKGIKLLY